MLLIDGDILVYQSIASAEKEVEYEEDLFVMYTNLSDAKDAFVTAYVNILAKAMEFGWDDIEGKVHLCLTDRNANWRKSVYPAYKSNRKKTRLPMGFKEFRAWVVDNYPTIVKPTLEADDVLGILATKPKNNALIWTIDKDLKTVPGNHLRDDGITVISEQEADYWHMYQTLVGDATDGYPGCKGVGPVKAKAILDSAEYPHQYWDYVCSAYAKAGLTEDDALVQARVARILRWDDWNMATQEVKLWSPHA